MPGGFKKLYNSLRTHFKNSVSIRRIWTKLGGNSSYKPPRAYYTAQGTQKQPEILKIQLCIFYENSKNKYLIYLYIPFLGALYSYIVPFGDRGKTCTRCICTPLLGGKMQSWARDAQGTSTHRQASLLPGRVVRQNHTHPPTAHPRVLYRLL